MAPKNYSKELAEILNRYSTKKISYDKAYLSICELNKTSFENRHDFSADPIALLKLKACKK